MDDFREPTIRERPGPVRRSLKAKTYQTRLEWLNAPLQWEGNRVVRVMPAPGGEGTITFLPTISDIAQAEYGLNRLTTLLRSEVARRETDTPQRMRDSLRLAKRLFALQEKVRVSAPRTHADISALIEWLLPEALAENLPANSPAQHLLCTAQQEALRPTTIAGLHAFIMDSAVPHAARILAALLLGMLSRDEEAASAAPVALSPDYRRAFRWARKHPLSRGIPIPLVARFLEREEGEGLAEQVVQALAYRQTVTANVALLLPAADDFWTLLHRGHAPRAIAALASVVTANAPLLVERLLHRRYHADELPEKLPRIKERERRKEVAERVREERAAVLAKLAAVRWRIVTASPEPATTCTLIDAFVHQVFRLWQLPAVVWESALVVPLVELARQLTPERYEAALELLIEHYPALYPTEEFYKDLRQYHTTSASDWFRMRKNTHVVPFLRLYRDTADTELLKIALQRELLPVLYPVDGYRWQDASLTRYAIHAVQSLGLINQLYTVYGNGITNLYRLLMAHYSSVQDARAEVEPLLHALHPQSTFLKAHLLDAWIREIEADSEESAIPRNRLRQMGRFFPLLAQFAAARDEERNCSCREMAESLIALIESCDGPVDTLFVRLVEFLKDKDVGEYYWLSDGVRIAAILTPGNPDRFIEIVRAFLSDNVSIRREFYSPALTVLRTYPLLRAPFAARFTEEPHRCLRLLNQLGRLWQRTERANLSEAEHPLHPWTLRTATTEPGSVTTEGDDWQHLCERAPDLAPMMADYWHACWIRGEALEVPKGVREILQLPEKLARELDYLETAIASGSGTPERIARRDNLQVQLADRESLEHRITEEARERMRNATGLLQLEAVEQTLQESIRVELRCLVGPRVPLPRYVDDDLFNAVEIGSSIDVNRKLITKLLRAYLLGEASAMIERHPANRRFRRWAGAQGIEVSRWLGEHSGAVTLPNGQVAHLYLETDPLRVLQMGNLFGTCLSANDINAFSTVANACDQNKRVLYACDAVTGRVLARKLIAIAENGWFVGFHTYIQRETIEGKQRTATMEVLRTAIDTFLLDFAKDCHIPTGDMNNVPPLNIPPLMAEHWYNDGIVPWQLGESGTLTPCKPLSPGQPGLSGKGCALSLPSRGIPSSLSRGMRSVRARHWAAM